MFSSLLRVNTTLNCKTNLKQISILAVRNSSFFQKYLKRRRESLILVDSNKHKIIYSYRSAKPILFFVKSRFFFALIGLLGNPIGSLFNLSSEVTMQLCWGCLFQYFIMLGVSRLFTNTITQVFVNKENDVNEVIVRAMNGYGVGFDRRFNPDDLFVSGFKSKLSKHAGFISVNVPKSNHVYKLNVVNYYIYDQKALSAIFGDLFKLKAKK